MTDNTRQISTLPATQIFCGSCGTAVWGHWAICPSCGSELDDAPPAGAAQGSVGAPAPGSVPAGSPGPAYGAPAPGSVPAGSPGPAYGAAPSAGPAPAASAGGSAQGDQSWRSLVDDGHPAPVAVGAPAWSPPQAASPPPPASPAWAPTGPAPQGWSPPPANWSPPPAPAWPPQPTYAASTSQYPAYAPGSGRTDVLPSAGRERATRSGSPVLVGVLIALLVLAIGGAIFGFIGMQTNHHDLQRSQQTLATAKADLDKARADLASAQSQLGDAKTTVANQSAQVASYKTCITDLNIWFNTDPANVAADTAARQQAEKVCIPLGLG